MSLFVTPRAAIQHTGLLSPFLSHVQKLLFSTDFLSHCHHCLCLTKKLRVQNRHKIPVCPAYLKGNRARKKSADNDNTQEVLDIIFIRIKNISKKGHFSSFGSFVKKSLFAQKCNEKARVGALELVCSFSLSH